MHKQQMIKSLTKLVKEEEYTLKDLTTISMFLQNLGQKQWPDMHFDIFELGEFIHEIKDSLYTDDAPIPFEDKEWGTDNPATENNTRSRKEKPPKTALRTVTVVGRTSNDLTPIYMWIVFVCCILAMLFILYPPGP